MEIVTDPFALTTLDYVRDTLEITQPLKLLGIDYFSYCETSEGNIVKGLINNGEFFQSYLENNWIERDIVNISREKYLSGLYLWEHIPERSMKVMSDYLRDQNISVGCTYTRQEGGIKKAYNFASRTNMGANALDLYLNKFELLEAFIRYFDEKAIDLIQSSNAILVAPKSSLQKKQYLKVSSESEEKFLNEVNYHTHKYDRIVVDKQLSPREIQCMDGIAQGKLTKQIADDLGLTVKTVEFYIRNLKEKLHCRTKSELIIKAVSS